MNQLSGLVVLFGYSITTPNGSTPVAGGGGLGGLGGLGGNGGGLGGDGGLGGGEGGETTTNKAVVLTILSKWHPSCFLLLASVSRSCAC
jgi:hypothetical protein